MSSLLNDDVPPKNIFGKTLLKNELAWILYREIPRLAPFIALAKTLFSKNYPSLLVTADDADQKCRAFSLYAKTKKN